jgi:hypothetical protein
VEVRSCWHGRASWYVGRDERGLAVLTNRPYLDRIQELSMRVRKLEVALEAAYAATTADTHPLLRPEARVDIPSMEVTRSDEEKDDADADDSELMNSAFSMLSIEEDVRTSRFTSSHYSLWYLDGKEQVQSNRTVCVCY